MHIVDPRRLIAALIACTFALGSVTALAADEEVGGWLSRRHQSHPV